jgi:hypothetical protein
VAPAPWLLGSAAPRLRAATPSTEATGAACPNGGKQSTESTKSTESTERLSPRPVVAAVGCVLDISHTMSSDVRFAWFVHVRCRWNVWPCGCPGSGTPPGHQMILLLEVSGGLGRVSMDLGTGYKPHATSRHAPQGEGEGTARTAQGRGLGPEAAAPSTKGPRQWQQWKPSEHRTVQNPDSDSDSGHRSSCSYFIHYPKLQLQSHRYLYTIDKRTS